MRVSEVKDSPVQQTAEQALLDGLSLSTGSDATGPRKESTETTTTAKRQTTTLVLWAVSWALALSSPLSSPLSSLKAIPSRTGFNQFCLLSELLFGSGSGNLDDKLAFAAD